MTNPYYPEPVETPPVTIPARNATGVVALALTALGIGLSFVPDIVGYLASWLILLGAPIVAGVGAARRGREKVTSVIALAVLGFWYFVRPLVIAFLVSHGLR